LLRHQIIISVDNFSRHRRDVTSQSEVM
jgi:hypothetical protein